MIILYIFYNIISIYYSNRFKQCNSDCSPLAGDDLQYRHRSLEHLEQNKGKVQVQVCPEMQKKTSIFVFA